jgi:hypothetical protein
MEKRLRDLLLPGLKATKELSRSRFLHPDSYIEQIDGRQIQQGIKGVPHLFTYAHR